MTNEQVKQIANDRMVRDNNAQLRGEDVAEDAALRSLEGAYADFAVDPMESVDEALQGHDPRTDRQPKQADPKPKLAEATAESLLETWYVWEMCGRLKTVGLVPSGDSSAGVEEQLLASLYVESTPGFNRAIMMHGQDHRGEPEPFRSWYGNWPDNRSLAAMIYASFVQALTQRLKIEPFVIYASNVRTPDHLEMADAANEAIAADRNRAWRQRRVA